MKNIQVYFLVMLSVVAMKASAQSDETQLAIQTGHKGTINHLAISQDGKLLASSDDNNLLIIWFISTGNQMQSFQNDEAILDLSFATNGTSIYISSASGVETLDIATSKIVDMVPSRNVNNIVAWEEGYIGFGDQVINTTSIQGPFPSAPLAVASMKASGTLLMIDKEGYLTKRGNESEKIQLSLNRNNLSGVASISEDGAYAVFGYFAKLSTYDLKNNQSLFSMNGNFADESFSACAISSRNDLVVGGNTDGLVYVGNISRKKITNRLKGHLRGITSVIFSPDENLFVTASKDRSIIVWDSKTLKQVRKLVARSFRINSVTVAKNSSKIAFADEYGMVKTLDFSDLSFQVNYAKHHDNEISDLDFIANDSEIVIAGDNNKINVLDAETLESSRQKTFMHNVNRPASAKRKFMKLAGFYVDPYTEIDMIEIGGDDQYLYVLGDVPVKNGRKEQVELFDLSNWKRITDLSKEELGRSGEAFSQWYSLLTKAKLVGSNGIFVDTEENRVNIRNMKIVDEKLYMYSETQQILGIPGRDNFSMNIKVDLNHPFNRVFDIDTIKSMVAMADGNTLELVDYKTNEKISLLGHTDIITSVSFFKDRPLVITSSYDATLKLWNTENKELVATVVPIDFDKVVFVTPDNYYLAPKGAMDALGFSRGVQFYPAEQFDLIFNRPDIVLERLDFAGGETIDMFRKAYSKRLRKLNFSEEEITNPEFHLPVVTLNNENLPLQTTESSVILDITATDSKYSLDRLNISVNNVPIFGMKGQDLSSGNPSKYSGHMEVALSPGYNRVRVSTTNDKGVESLARVFEMECSATFPDPVQYIYTIGVSEYQQSQYNLQYAAKDARDLANLMQGVKGSSVNRIIEITDAKVGKETILQIRDSLLHTNVNDKVMLFIAGHGVLDDNLDYFLATHDMNFSDPSANGLAYEEIENILDGIPARNKLLMIDACHSGEVDKEEVEIINTTEVVQGDVIFRAIPGRQVRKVGLDNSYELMKTLFADLRKSSGAIVISSAGGGEYAMEGSKWKNGVFTYSLINGIRSKKADLNKDGEIRASELQQYLEMEVTRLTNGKQKPTSRVENELNDYIIWN